MTSHPSSESYKEDEACKELRRVGGWDFWVFCLCVIKRKRVDCSRKMRRKVQVENRDELLLTWGSNWSETTQNYWMMVERWISRKRGWWFDFQLWNLLLTWQKTCQVVYCLMCFDLLSPKMKRYGAQIIFPFSGSVFTLVFLVGSLWPFLFVLFWWDFKSEDLTSNVLVQCVLGGLFLMISRYCTSMFFLAPPTSNGSFFLE